MTTAHWVLVGLVVALAVLVFVLYAIAGDMSRGFVGGGALLLGAVGIVQSQRAKR